MCLCLCKITHQHTLLLLLIIIPYICVLLYHSPCAFTYSVLFHPHNSPPSQAGRVVLGLFHREATKAETCSNISSNIMHQGKSRFWPTTHMISDPTSYHLSFVKLGKSFNMRLSSFICELGLIVPHRIVVRIKTTYIKCLTQYLAYYGLLMLFPASSPCLKFHNQ